MPGTIQMQMRRDLATSWASNNPILAKAEFGVEKSDLGIRFKIGDGVTSWNDLPYQTTIYSGVAMLSTGLVVVAAAWVVADSVIIVTAQAAPGTPGAAIYVDPADIVVGTSFTIKSDDATDARSVFWMGVTPHIEAT